MPDVDRVITEVTATLVKAEATPEAIVAAVVEGLADARPVMWVASLLTKDPTLMRVIARDGGNEEIGEYINQMQRGGGLTSAPVSSRVIESGQPLLIPRISTHDYVEQYLDAPTRSQLESRPFPADIRELSVLVVPMRAAGATIGTLGMFLYHSSVTLGEKDIAWLQLAADQTGLAVKSAQLAADAKKRLAKIDAIQAVLDAIRSSQDLNMALNIVCYRVTSILGIDACDVLLIDEPNDAMVTKAASGFSATSMADFRLPLDNPLLRQALASRRLEDLRSAGVLDNARRRSVFAREGFRSYAALPLTSRGRLFGALEVFQRSDLNPDVDWLEFLDIMAGMATLAIELVTLREQLLEQRPFRKTGAAPSLSAVEVQILRLLVEGQTNREIAAQVHLSQSTIKFHVRQILDKTGAANRTDLTRRATREGWV